MRGRSIRNETPNISNAKSLTARTPCAKKGIRSHRTHHAIMHIYRDRVNQHGTKPRQRPELPECLNCFHIQAYTRIVHNHDMSEWKNEYITYYLRHSRVAMNIFQTRHMLRFQCKLF